jgi:nucleotide-binding universal stress UspA family protein
LLAERYASYVEGLAIAPVLSPFLPTDAIGGSVAVVAESEQAAVAVREARQIFDAFVAETKGITSGWEGDLPHDDAFVANYARTFDVTVLGRPGTAETSPHMSTLETALFDSGRPVLIAPPLPPTTLGERVVIGWNRSSETARTVAFALPLLARAREVTIVSIEDSATNGPGGPALGAYLQRHGIACSVNGIRRGEKGNVGPAILEEAAKAGADLLIKGAYTQSRLSQAIFGGATRHILAEATMPVFMAH